MEIVVDGKQPSIKFIVSHLCDLFLILRCVIELLLEILNTH